MTITVSKGDVFTTGAELVVVPVFAAGDFDPASLKGLDEALKKRLAKAVKTLDFKGQVGQTVVLPVPAGSDADLFLLVGLGDRKRDNLNAALREAVGLMVNTAKRFGLRTIALDLTGREFKPEAGEAVATAAFLADYVFETYKQPNPAKKIGTIDVIVQDSKAAQGMRKFIDRAQTIVEGVTIARDLVNMPAQEMTPTHLAEAAEEVAKASNQLITVKVLNRTDCAKLNMGAFLAVAQGSHSEPKFIHLTYTSPRPTKKSLAVVGKGVTFDSGGLSLKPADAMMTMKCDMAGGAAVIGFFATLARLKPRVNIHGIIAATENMVSSKSIRPGDVVRASNGKTIEILNTDAEGRLTLADAITYVLKENPDAIIDLATLTGACVVALGEEISGLMTNNRALGKQVLTAAAAAGEKLWELPLEPRYRDLIKSDVADLRNIATSRYGGTLTAGLFIEEFVAGKPWAHLDIAGPAFAERAMSSYITRGATGCGVRTLVELVEAF